MNSKASIERRFERLRPEQIRILREPFPLAFLPLGAIEWHGPQNPIGLDGLKAHGICLRVAERTGGLVFPPLYYGAPPTTRFTDGDDYHPAFAEAYGVPEENFLPERFAFPRPVEQWEVYTRLLDETLRMIARFGFEAIFALAGHYPMSELNHICQAFEREQGIPVLLTKESLIPGSGDHAGQWETSLMLGIEPDLVDEKAFPPAGQPNPPACGGKPVSEVTRELAESNLSATIEALIAEVSKLMDRRTECQCRVETYRELRLRSSRCRP